MPKGCIFPDCFNCPLADCELSDTEDVLGDIDAELEIEELEEIREALRLELRAKGSSTQFSVEYHRISGRIHYLRNRDTMKIAARKRYESKKK